MLVVQRWAVKRTCTWRTLDYCEFLSEDPAQSVQLGCVQIGRGIIRPLLIQDVDMSIFAACGLEHGGHVLKWLLLDIARGADFSFDIYNVLGEGKSIKG